ncbi:hypothetical protein GIB67_020484 [Kingdonia uniflora]|uniref:Uncharacterized protein n=1 Tax=Kingdonia uniflora TaxID=39325 RepID=A0A7J7LV31_9MAGN|nr:hypothetical protein GIB67_020484 [Kingdonia uniflora]
MLFVRSESIKRALGFSFESFPFNDLSERLPKTLRLIFVSRAVLLLRYKRHLKHTWWVSLKTPICTPTMPRGSLSCLRTYSLLEGFVERGLREIFYFC